MPTSTATPETPASEAPGPGAGAPEAPGPGAGAPEAPGPGAGAPEAPGPGASTPISKLRLRTCRDSAYYWGRALQRYADSNQRRADLWALTAGVVAAITSLSVWPVSSAENGFATVLVAAGALATSLCALIPRVFNFSERSAQAREIEPLYGRVYGELLDLCACDVVNQENAAAVLATFQDVKAKKDGLRGLRPRDSELPELHPQGREK